MARGYLQTILDLVKLSYSDAGARFIQKDAPVLSDTQGVYNAIYGAEVWSQLNQEANVFGILPKAAWTISGWRVLTERFGAAATYGGVAENSALPATIKPTWQELSTLPKTVAHTFDVSEIQQFLSQIGDDDAIGSIEMLRPLAANHHREMINKMLTDNVTNIVNVDGNTEYNLESIDRVVSSYGEVTNCGDVDAGDSDIYELDRDAQATIFDAYVDHNNNSPRDLTDELLRTLLFNARKLGAKPTVWVTGPDTYAAIQGLYGDQIRYNLLGAAQAKIGVNGIDTKDGFGIGLDVATIYGIPLIESKDIVVDTISRIYLLDTSNPEGYSKPRLGIDISFPTQYFEAGMNVSGQDPFGINRLGNEGMYRTVGELKCRFFPGQAKLRDLQ